MAVPIIHAPLPVGTVSPRPPLPPVPQTYESAGLALGTQRPVPVEVRGGTMNARQFGGVMPQPRPAAASSTGIGSAVGAPIRQALDNERAALARTEADWQARRDAVAKGLQDPGPRGAFTRRVPLPGERVLRPMPAPTADRLITERLGEQPQVQGGPKLWMPGTQP